MCMYKVAVTESTPQAFHFLIKRFYRKSEEIVVYKCTVKNASAQGAHGVMALSDTFHGAHQEFLESGQG